MVSQLQKVKWFDLATFLVSQGVAVGIYFLLFLVLPAVLAGLALMVLLVGGVVTGGHGRTVIPSGIVRGSPALCGHRGSR